MSDGKSVQKLLLGNEEDIRLLLEWQQQKYYQLQNLSLAVFGGFLTLLAIMATILSPHLQSFLKAPPTPSLIKSEISNSIFNHTSMSAIFILSYILSIFLFLLAALFAVYGLYRLYDIIANPPLRPKLEGVSVLQGDYPVSSSLERIQIGTAQEEFQSAIIENQELIELTRRKFGMALLRFPTAIGVGFFATEVYFATTTSIDVGNVLLLNVLWLLPNSISAFVMNKIALKTEDSSSEYNTLGEEIIKNKDGGRFPDEFISFERWLVIGNNLLAVLVLLSAVLDLSSQYLV